MTITTFKLVLVLLAAVCFFASAFGINTPRVNIQSLGLFLLAVSMLITGI